MNALVQALLAAVSAAYPFLWYYGRDLGWFGVLAAGMALLWLLRCLFQRDKGRRAVSALLALFFAAVWLTRSPQSMYWYPVCVNLLLLAVFGASLFGGPSLIERLARLRDPELPEQAVAYTRRLTWIWCAFFVFNGSTAALLALWQRHDWWALYTGVIAYVLMGLLMGGEWLYRKTVLRV